MDHNTMLAFLMGQRRGGGSSGGEATYWWVPFCADGVTWMGETVDNGAELAGGLFDIIELAEVKTKQYRVTVDGISYLCTDNGSGGSTYIDGNHIQIESNECPATIIAEGSFDPVVVTFADGNSHTLKVEAWVGEEPYVEGGSSDIFKEIFDKTITEVTSDATTVNDYAFQNCASLTKAIFPKANAIKQHAFDGCASLAEIDFKEVTTVGAYCFQDCVSLEEVRLPKLTGKTSRLFRMEVGNGAGGVNNGTAVRLKVADLGFVTTVDNYTFRHCTSLTTVILRSPTVATLEHIGAFWYTPFYHIATGGTVYVPAALIESYKAASNWTALHTSASLNFAQIEGSEYE